jgi:hypothetical protein
MPKTPRKKGLTKSKTYSRKEDNPIKLVVGLAIVLTIGFLTVQSLNSSQPTKETAGVETQANLGKAARFDSSYVNTKLTYAQNQTLCRTKTVETWVQLPVGNTWGISRLVSFNPTWTGGDHYQLIISSQRKVVYYTRLSNNELVPALSSTTTLEPGKWYHIATGFRFGPNIPTAQQGVYMYINGKLENFIHVSKTPYQCPASPSLQIGHWGETGTVLLDELRLSDSVRYMKDFVPSSTPFVSDSNTLGLWHFDGNTQDASGKYKSSTNEGTISYLESSAGNIDSTITQVPYSSPTPTIAPNPVPIDIEIPNKNGVLSAFGTIKLTAHVHDVIGYRKKILISDKTKNTVLKTCDIAPCTVYWNPSKGTHLVQVDVNYIEINSRYSSASKSITVTRP